MSASVSEDLAARAALYRVLGEPVRLLIVELVALSDRTPGELRDLTGVEWSLLGFHLRALEAAGVVERHGSEGDRRRRYVRLRGGVLPWVPVPPRVAVGVPLFVCTGNAARSQFAAALWAKTTGRPATSAGSVPAAVVHPLTVEVAATYGVDVSGARPRGFDAVDVTPDLVVSVCDRAFEGGVPFDVPKLHWSVPNPASGGRAAFEQAFADIAERLERLAAVAA